MECGEKPVEAIIAAGGGAPGGARGPRGGAANPRMDELDKVGEFDDDRIFSLSHMYYGYGISLGEVADRAPEREDLGHVGPVGTAKTARRNRGVDAARRNGGLAHVLALRGQVARQEMGPARVVGRGLRHDAADAAQRRQTKHRGV